MLSELANLCNMKASRTEFKNKTGEFLRIAYKEPVIISDYGKDSHVLLHLADYEKLLSRIAELEAEKERLAMMLETSKQG